MRKFKNHCLGITRQGLGGLMPTYCLNCLHTPVGLNKLITCKGVPLRATLTIANVFSLKHQQYLLTYGALLEEKKNQLFRSGTITELDSPGIFILVCITKGQLQTKYGWLISGLNIPLAKY